MTTLLILIVGFLIMFTAMKNSDYDFISFVMLAILFFLAIGAFFTGQSLIALALS